jgi:hypothetical protein
MTFEIELGRMKIRLKVSPEMVRIALAFFGILPG